MLGGAPDRDELIRPRVTQRKIAEEDPRGGKREGTREKRANRRTRRRNIGVERCTGQRRIDRVACDAKEDGRRGAEGRGCAKGFEAREKRQTGSGRHGGEPERRLVQHGRRFVTPHADKRAHIR